VAGHDVRYTEQTVIIIIKLNFTSASSLPVIADTEHPLQKECFYGVSKIRLKTRQYIYLCSAAAVGQLLYITTFLSGELPHLLAANRIDAVY
jgi:hypothetical protein